MTPEEFEAALDAEAQKAADSAEMYELRNALREANDKLAKAKMRADAVAEAAFEGAKAAFLAQPRPKIKPYAAKSVGKGRPEAALLHSTDWQGSKVTESYNSAVMADRVNLMVDKTLALTEIQRKDHPVPSIHVLFGGDMIEGLFNYPTQPFEIDMTLFDQFVNVASLIAHALRRLAQGYTRVHVHPEWGNHGRLGSKRDAVPRSDNADRMTYRLAEEMTKDVPNIIWQDYSEDIQRVEIGNYRALLLHGDEVGRNGFASPTTILSHANRWKSGAYPWDFQDIYIGHYHTHMELPMANGRGHVFQTGSTESDNRYARETMAASAVPSQRLHFVDPRDGIITSQYQLYLA